MRVLITGGSGVVGWSLARHALALGREVHLTYLSHPLRLEGAQAHALDVTDEAAVAALIARVCPDAVYHCAALTSVDLCETQPALGRLHNTTATGFVAHAAASAGATLLYLSTSFVFGASLAPLSEQAPCHPATRYGESKAEGEREVRRAGDDHLILRIDQPYGWVEAHQKQNTVVRVVHALEAGQAVREPSDWFNSPTCLNDFVLLAEALRSRSKRGTYNCVGADFLSRYEWAQRIARAFGLDGSRVSSFPSSELKLPALRPRVRLDISKAQADAGRPICGIDAGLADMVRTRPRAPP